MIVIVAGSIVVGAATAARAQASGISATVSVPVAGAYTAPLAWTLRGPIT